MPKPKRSPGFPTREQILDFIASSETPAGKREIARAFGLTAQEKIGTWLFRTIAALECVFSVMLALVMAVNWPGPAFAPAINVMAMIVVVCGGPISAYCAWKFPQLWPIIFLQPLAQLFLMWPYI